MKKTVLQERAAEALDEKRGEQAALNDNRDILSTLSSLWAAQASMGEDEIDLDESVYTFVDSITLMQLCARVANVLRRQLSPGDIDVHQTIRQQAALLETRKEVKSVAAASMTRKQTSTLEPQDVVFLKDDDMEAFRRLQSEVEDAISARGYTWKDVEQVLPLPPLGALTLSNHRHGKSYTHRHVFRVERTSPQEGAQAMRAVLRRHDAIRTTITRSFSAVTLCYSERLADEMIATGSVERGEDVDSLRSSDEEDVVRPPGPLFKAIFVRAEDTGETYLLWHLHHAVFDAWSLGLVRKDLEAVLAGEDRKTEVLPWKEYAEWRYKCAQDHGQNTHFFADRMVGISQDTLWPLAQMTPPHDYRFSSSEAKLALEGVSRRVRLPGLKLLQQHHGIMPATLAKTAVSRLESACIASNADFSLFPQLIVTIARDIGWKNVVFCQSENGRMSAQVDSPFSVTGPMLEFCINRISTDASETVLSLLSRVQTDQFTLSAHCQTSISNIQQALNEGQQVQDAEAITDLIHRTTWNFRSDWNVEKQAKAREPPRMRLETFHGRSDLDFVWTAGLTAPEELLLLVRWEPWAIYPEAAEKHGEDVLAACQWLLDNLEKQVGACVFDSRCSLPGDIPSLGLQR